MTFHHYQFAFQVLNFELMLLDYCRKIVDAVFSFHLFGYVMIFLNMVSKFYFIYSRKLSTEKSAGWAGRDGDVTPEALPHFCLVMVSIQG